MEEGEPPCNDMACSRKCDVLPVYFATKVRSFQLEHQQVRHPDEDWDADQWGAVSLEDLEKMAGQESVRI